MREENDALLEQSTREEERADQSTKKLLKAEKVQYSVIIILLRVFWSSTNINTNWLTVSVVS